LNAQGTLPLISRTVGKELIYFLKFPPYKIGYKKLVYAAPHQGRFLFLKSAVIGKLLNYCLWPRRIEGTKYFLFDGFLQFEQLKQLVYF